MKSISLPSLNRSGSLRRLGDTLQLDMLLQLRNGFYYASAFILLVVALAAYWLPDMDLVWLMPALILSNLPITTFYFVAGLVLLEKSEGTLQAQVVSPLRSGEYLGSKVITLSTLALLETGLLVILLGETPTNILLFGLGCFFAASLLTSAGFLVVVRYDSLSEYLLPSILYLIFLLLPLLEAFNLWSSPLLFLHPLQGVLLMLEAAFDQRPLWQAAVGISLSTVWFFVLVYLAKKQFSRFVVRGEGVR